MVTKYKEIEQYISDAIKDNEERREKSNKFLEEFQKNKKTFQWNITKMAKKSYFNIFT